LKYLCAGKERKRRETRRRRHQVRKRRGGGGGGGGVLKLSVGKEVGDEQVLQRLAGHAALSPSLLLGQADERFQVLRDEEARLRGGGWENVESLGVGKEESTLRLKKGSSWTSMVMAAILSAPVPDFNTVESHLLFPFLGSGNFNGLNLEMN
jgi:hypothetical protein